jgi:hypothetical protein
MDVLGEIPAVRRPGQTFTWMTTCLASTPIVSVEDVRRLFSAHWQCDLENGCAPTCAVGL